MEERICGLIVAAGLSSRMGCFKPLLPLRGKTVIENTIDSMLLCGISPVVIVLGYRGREVEAVLRSRYLAGTVIPVYNRDFASTDMLASIQLGAAALPPCSAFFLMPGDMPVVTKETFLTVCRARSGGVPSITFPTLDGYRKHRPRVHPRHLLLSGTRRAARLLAAARGRHRDRPGRRRRLLDRSGYV